MNQHCDAEALYMYQAHTAAETLYICLEQVSCDAEALCVCFEWVSCDAEAMHMSFEQVNGAHHMQKPCTCVLNESAKHTHCMQKLCMCVLNEWTKPTNPVQKLCTCLLNKWTRHTDPVQKHGYWTSEQSTQTLCRSVCLEQMHKAHRLCAEALYMCLEWVNKLTRFAEHQLQPVGPPHRGSRSICVPPQQQLGAVSSPFHPKARLRREARDGLSSCFPEQSSHQRWSTDAASALVSMSERITWMTVCRMKVFKSWALHLPVPDAASKCYGHGDVRQVLRPVSYTHLTLL